MIGTSQRFRLFAGGALIVGTCMASSADSAASPLDPLTDLTGKVNVIVTFKGRDNFTSEYRYDISVRNQLPVPLIADSLIVVLDKITNLAGDEREPLKNETILSRFEVFGQEGQTDDAKPFFRIPAGATPDLAPQAESLPTSVRLRNRDYVAVFTPSFRAYGLKRPPAEAKQPSPATPSATPPRQTPDRPMDKLIQLLIKKGVITEEEWRKAIQP